MISGEGRFDLIYVKHTRPSGDNCGDSWPTTDAPPSSEPWYGRIGFNFFQGDENASNSVGNFALHFFPGSKRTNDRAVPADTKSRRSSRLL